MGARTKPCSRASAGLKRAPIRLWMRRCIHTNANTAIGGILHEGATREAEEKKNERVQTMKCACGRIIRNQKGGIEHKLCSLCRNRDHSPARYKRDENGKFKVGRLRFSCPCGETFSVLFSPRNKCEAVCPRCHSLAIELKANARLEDFSLKVMPWKIECTG